MTYKQSTENLLKEGIIKSVALDSKAVWRLINRAFKDLRTAERNIDNDEECAFSCAYNAMLRSGLALMLNEGFRPDIKDKHLTVVKFIGLMLGNEFKKIVNDYDFMRRKRHKFIYEPYIPCSQKEAKDAIETAEKFVGLISKMIKKNNPQSEFNF
jgi:uncharacterized protein (UPF0332 family)